MTTDQQAIPPGWDYNPSTWPQRLPIVFLALIGTGIAGYLAAYQARWISTVWEPFFGDGSRVVLNSPASRILPISDAAIGTIGYLADAITGVFGGIDRWRKRPWLVIIFGIAVGPFGMASVILVILQPVLYDNFCTLCLASAVISLAMIGPAMDEMLASMQALRRHKSNGGSVWHGFWKGVPA